MARLLRSVILILLAGALLSGCASMGVSEGDSAEAILDKADQARKSELYSQAIETYQRLESLYPYSREALQAQLMTAYTYYLKGDALPAVNAADRFIRLHPRNPHVDYARYLKGIAHYANIGEPDRDTKHAKKAIEAFSQLIRQHPESGYASDAVRRMRRADSVLARHQIHVARYYMDRQAYVAVVNRCHRVLTDHGDPSAFAPALGLMAEGYARMGLDELAQETLVILARNYPDSPELATARSAVENAPVVGPEG
ncbi:outer membrane protein assembly factor BamD [Thiohalorhabdus sp.]|uniref:outer membrane protein assembly factor BamD n=1 Tax=Thiohalorhabdus sp. TaxID=3094134 RepID=UPI002FC3CAFA